MTRRLPPEILAHLPEILAHLREQREAPRAFVDAVRSGDLEQLGLAWDRVQSVAYGLSNAIRLCVRLSAVSDEIRNHFHKVWYQHGDHLRCECGHDLTLAKALRVLLPPYSGPAMTLYRGDSAWNRKRRTYGLAWTSSDDVADDFARGIWRTFEGGSVVLQAEVPAEGIICAPALLGDVYGEVEYLVDRRHLRRVTVLRRYSQVQPA